MTQLLDTAHRAPTAPSRRLGHLPGLDGLRAIAVGAVFLFHAGVISGGFLGVDVFFVISGFLITALAITEIESTGRLRLGAFWGRRVRRLLPALYALCAAAVAYVAVEGGSAARDLGREVVGTLLYVANWQQIGADRDYFAIYEEPSLLEHTWSLAVEEQFYIVWPIAVVLIAALVRRRRWELRPTIFVVASGAAIASSLWAWVLAHDGGTGLNRVYFGTDTRAVGLAVGCAAACLLTNGARTGRRPIGPVQSGLALAGGAVLVVMMLRVDGSERWMYGPGFFVVAIASLLMINAASGRGALARTLSFGPLVVIGRVSYGVYLWHWPVIVVFDEQRTGLDGLALGATWVLLTAVLVTGSWWLIERTAPQPRTSRPLRAAGYAAIGALIGVAAVSVTKAEEVRQGDIVVPPAPALTDNDPSAAAQVPAAAPATQGSGPVLQATPSTLSEESMVADAAEAHAPDAVVAESTVPPPTVVQRQVPVDRPLRLLVLGDSVGASLGSGPGTLRSGEIDVQVVNRSIIGCPVLTVGLLGGGGGVEIPDPPDCVTEDGFAPFVEEVAPDVVLTLFGWSGDFGGRILENGEVLEPCEPGFDEPFGAAYEELEDRLSQSATVVVANIAPSGRVEPGEAIRTGCMNAQLDGRGFIILDVAGWLCPGGDCTQYADLRPDGLHFADDAGVRAQVWDVLISEVLRTAGYRPAA